MAFRRILWWRKHEHISILERSRCDIDTCVCSSDISSWSQLERRRSVIIISFSLRMQHTIRRWLFKKLRERKRAGGKKNITQEVMQFCGNNAHDNQRLNDEYTSISYEIDTHTHTHTYFENCGIKGHYGASTKRETTHNKYDINSWTFYYILSVYNLSSSLKWLGQKQLDLYFMCVHALSLSLPRPSSRC